MLAGIDRGRVHRLWLDRGARPACDPRTVVGGAFVRSFMRNRRQGGFHAHPAEVLFLVFILGLLLAFGRFLVEKPTE